jgi:hypothetical protein
LDGFIFHESINKSFNEKMSSIFGNMQPNVVTLTGDQHVTGHKRFLNQDNELEGTLIQPTIIADDETISTTELSFLAGISSNIQTQFMGINVVLDGLTALEQALQALDPAPDAETVQFSSNVILTDNAGLHLDINPSRITFFDDNSGTSSRITASNYDGNANTAGYASSAGTATSANYATSAGSANSATTATTATNATNSLISAVSTGVYYPTFSTNTSGNQTLLASAPLYYNATTSTLFSNSFSGTNFLGNANTASSATTATFATSVNTTVETAAGNNCPIGFFTGSSGQQGVKVGATFTCTPSNGTLRATIFEGALSGLASAATNVGITSDNTSGAYYIPFVKTSGTAIKALFIDDAAGPLSYNPSTSTLSASAYTITGTPATAGVASTFGQVGLVYLGAVQVAVTGSAVAQNLTFGGLFNSSYKNYRIHLAPTTQVTYTTYPGYSLQGFVGTSVPTVASLYGFEITSSSTALVTAIYTANATLSTAPLLFAVSSPPNKQVVFEVRNVGYANTASQLVEIQCKSAYSNPGITGASDRTINCTSVNGATIRGLVIQQYSLGVGNNMTLEATVYGYNLI